MRVALVITDSFGDCTKALSLLRDFRDKFTAEVEVLAVLEDLYKLEKASVSLGVPLSPDTVPSAKRRFEDRLINGWKQTGDGEMPEYDVVAGEIREEVLKYVKEKGPDLLLFGCSSAHDVCKVIDEAGVSSLIIK